MKKIKHNKLRNTGIIFELLVRQLTSDILNNKDSKAISIIKEFFNKQTGLIQELKLYQTLTNEQLTSDWKASQLLEAVISTRKKSDNELLEKSKYKLIKKIRESYNLEDFFQHKVSNYKLLASIYKLFEYAESDNPMDVINSKECIYEHLLRKNQDTPSAETLLEMEFGKQDKDIRILTYKILLEKFNEKYKGLCEDQKKLLRLYITTSPENKNELYEFIVSSINSIKTELNEKIKKCDNQVIQIKLNEASNLLNSLMESKTVKDNQVLSLLRYFELLKELRKVN
jgi:hypothetical protein